MSQFELIPIDMVKKVLYKLSPYDLRSLCSTDKSMRNICDDEKFWHQYTINNNYNVDYYNKLKQYVNN